MLKGYFSFTVGFVNLQEEPRLLTVPYFSMGFSRLVRFDRTPAILVYNDEGNLGRLYCTPGLVGVSLLFGSVHAGLLVWLPLLKQF